jgi:hypothetical protein
LFLYFCLFLFLLTRLMGPQLFLVKSCQHRFMTQLVCYRKIVNIRIKIDDKFDGQTFSSMLNQPLNVHWNTSEQIKVVRRSFWKKDISPIFYF